jgi:CHAD domain-containing protein
LKRTAVRLKKLIPDGKNGGGKGTSNGQTEIAAEAAATALKLATELKNVPALNKNNLHPCRLKVKELRNVLQLADHPGNQAFIDALGEVKDAIGEWHDWEELIAIADDLLDHGPGCKLLQALKQVSARKYERALSLANKLRKDFLGASPGRKPQSPSKHPLPLSVLEATAAIAS